MVFLAVILKEAQHITRFEMLNKHDFHMINRFLLYGSNELFLNKKEKGFPYVLYNVQSIPILILSSPTIRI